MFESKTVQETCILLECNDKRGLTEEEVKRRQGIHGPNVLKEKRKKTPVESFLQQLCDPLIYVLLAAAGISILLHEVSDAVIIIAVVCLNAFVGTLQEGKAQKALDSLKKLTQPAAFVIRDGREMEIPAAQLVPGDLVCLEAGGQVPADLRLTFTGELQVEESALTGETVPVRKEAKFCSEAGRETPLGDRKNMAFMSTIVTGGRGRGIVCACGMETQIGKIAAMMQESQEELTPLQKRLGDLGKMLSFLSVGICAALFLLAILQKRDVFDMLLTAISLAVAAVPEGLPAVVTICLALSVTRMVKVNTIIRRLPSVETLGCVSVVCSDKTGTLTRNRMTVENCFLEGKMFSAEALSAEKNREFLTAMALCNDAKLEERIGDPTELALLDLAAGCGIMPGRLEEQMPRTGELAFDSDRKMMSTLHRTPEGSVLFTKGAPDRVMPRCAAVWDGKKAVPMTGEQRRKAQEAVSLMSSQALRTLAIACKKGGSLTEDGLTLLGIVGMKDPIRPEVPGAVEMFKKAGVSTVMITGDHVETAFAIGKQLGIVEKREQCMTGEELDRLGEGQEGLSDVRVFARVSPAHKVQIVKAFQRSGHIVAMTGDGVNDAPSLKVADVGVAMGKNGTDVARQASDMVLTDDNFATIEKAIEEGRGVYENIKKSVIFLLSSNLGEVITMFAAVLFGLSSPLKSAHILWINLITDSLPALALGVDQNDGKELMSCPPRKAKESLFAGGGWNVTLFYGVLIAGISLTAFFTLPFSVLKARGLLTDIALPELWAQVKVLLSQEGVLAVCQTYAFTVLGMSQLFHAIGMRDVHKSVFGQKLGENRLMIAALLVGFALQVLVTEVPFLVKAFSTAPLSGWEWLYLTGLSAFPLLAHEMFVLLGKMSAGWGGTDRKSGSQA